MSSLSNISPYKLALLAHEARASETLRALRSEPIAIVGLSCRFPGAATPHAFAELLGTGGDAVGPIPAARWDSEQFFDPEPGRTGKSYANHAAFLDQVTDFDAAFFGIAPREAARMDPQQRVFLEVTWHAIEDAAIAPSQLAGTAAGVFAGVCAADYVLFQYDSLADIDAYSGSGASHSIVSNRLSYLLDLRGPSVTVDTACSSSLTAVHLACDALRDERCHVAIAGGVNLLLAPEGMVALSRARMLARDGRCKAFDAAADGFVRGEGCGVIVLKRLSDALRDRDRIRAIIRGSACNQDGSSNGLTAPNVAAQEAVLRAALADAQLDPERVTYVEAHGTGTLLGDPIEAEALQSVFGAGNTRCAVGAVKTNVGHLEGAAGIAGLIKVVLALESRRIYPNLHFQTLNPNIEWRGSRLFVPRELSPWESASGTRCAAVSSFGFGGTNVNVVLEEARALPRDDEPTRPAHLLCLSARSENARAALARAYANHLAESDFSAIDLADLCFTANTGRAHFEQRVAVVAESPGELRDALLALAQGEHCGSAVTGSCSVEREASLCFLLPGRTTHAAGSGAALFELVPVFRQHISECDELYRELTNDSLLDLVLSTGGAGGGDLSAAPLFAFEYALAKLMMHWGAQPTYVIGQGVGELVAACLASVLSLRDGLRLAICLTRHEDVAPSARALELSEPKLGLISSVTGARIETEHMRAPDYWRVLARGERLCDGLAAISALGSPLFVQLGAEPALMERCQRALPEARLRFITTLRTRAAGPRELLEAAAQLYVEGVALDHHAFDARAARRRVPLPGYPFDRQHFPLRRHAPRTQSVKAVLGMPRPSPFVAAQFDLDLDPARPLFGDHRVNGTPVVAAAFYVVTALTAALRRGVAAPTLSDVRCAKALELRGRTHAQVLVAAEPDGDEIRFVSAEPSAGQAWNVHATARIRKDASHTPSERVDVESLRSKLSRSLSGAELSDAMHARGYELEHEYEWLQDIHTGDAEAFGSLRAPQESDDGHDLVLAPGLLDACFQLFGVTWAERRREDCLYLPMGVDEVSYYGVSRGPLFCHALLREAADDDRMFVGDLRLCNALGEIVAEVRGLSVRGIAPLRSSESLSDVFYKLEWQRAQASSVATTMVARSWWLVGDAELCPRLAAELHAKGETVRCVAEASNMPDVEGPDRIVFAPAPADFTPEAELALAERGLSIAQRAVRLGGKARLTLVTRGVFAARGPHSGAALWGMGRALAVEHADCAGGLIDAPAVCDGHDVALLATALLLSDREPELRVDSGALWTSRLARCAPDSVAPRVRPGVSYLISGGLGGLGQCTARGLIDAGASSIILVGRSLEPARIAALSSWASERGARIHAYSVDVCDREALQTLLEHLRGHVPPLAGVVHAAGIRDDASLVRQTAARLSAVYAPKLLGAVNLIEALRDDQLDFFVAFTSAAGLFGSAGQCNYAAANASLDAAVRRWRAEGRPALSIQWGPWAQTGMAATLDARDLGRLAAQGLELIAPERGVRAFGLALAAGAGELAVLAIDWRKLAASPLAQRPLFRNLLPTVAAPHAPLHLPARNAVPLGNALTERVRAEVRAVLGLDERMPLESERPFRDVGLDSLMALDLSKALSDAFGLELPSTLVFDYPSIDALVPYLRAQLGEDESDSDRIHAPAPKPPPPEGPANVADLSERELELFVSRELERLSSDA